MGGYRCCDRLHGRVARELCRCCGRRLLAVARRDIDGYCVRPVRKSWASTTDNGPLVRWETHTVSSVPTVEQVPLRHFRSTSRAAPGGRRRGRRGARQRAFLRLEAGKRGGVRDDEDGTPAAPDPEPLAAAAAILLAWRLASAAGSSDWTPRARRAAHYRAHARAELRCDIRASRHVHLQFDRASRELEQCLDGPRPVGGLTQFAEW